MSADVAVPVFHSRRFVLATRRALGSGTQPTPRTACVACACSTSIRAVFVTERGFMG